MNRASFAHPSQKIYFCKMMSRILFDIIIELLDRHSCVIVPGWGGFVVNDKEAQRVGTTGTFLPPSKEVIFNQLLTHNDGLLIQEWMKRSGESFDVATASVAREVEAIQEEVRVKRSCDVAGLGTFVWQEEGSGTRQSVVFHSQKLMFPNHEAYGLREFYYPELKAEDPSNQSAKSGTVRHFLAGTAAAVALVFLLQPTATEHSSDMASLSPNTMLMATLQTEVAQKDRTIMVLETELNSYKKAPVGFYLVLSDFADRESALAYIKSNGLQKLENLSVLDIDHHFYVSVASAPSRDELMEQKVLIGERLDYTEDMYILSVAKMSE